MINLDFLTLAVTVIAYVSIMGLAFGAYIELAGK